VFLAPRFIVGTTITKLLAQKLWKINRPGHLASGTVFLMMFVCVSLIWLWMYDQI
jgi:hypothetical protein